MTLNHDRLATDGTYVNGEDATSQVSVIKPSSSTSSEKTANEPLNPDAKSYAYIPPIEEQGRRYSQGRNLVLCFDGTGDQFDDDNSNVVGLCSMLKKDDPSRQLVYYQAGIGTYLPTSITSSIVSAVSKVVDSCIAWSLDDHIMSGYEFLMQNYREGDRICIFGFSRGAYTARCLAGMLHKVGLLPASNSKQIPFAYNMYQRDNDLGWKQSNAFKQAFCIDVDIDFLGVWDTVSSVGVIPKKRLPFSSSNTVVRVFRHAVSLDERRTRFQPNTWNEPHRHDAAKSVKDQEIELLRKKREASRKERKPHDDAVMRTLEKKYSKTRTEDTDVEEVWFAGAHCDVGGGSVVNGSRPCLAHIPLRWMIRQCFATETGILFSTLWLARLGLHPSSVWPAVVDRNKIPPAPFTPTACRVMSIPKKAPSLADAYTVDDNEYDMEYLLQETEEERDLKDSLAPLYDQLSLNRRWWLLELIPTKHRHQNADATWSEEYHVHLGRGRDVNRRHRKVKVHRTVQARMAAEPPINDSWISSVRSFFGRKREGKQYKPKANLKLDNVEWVV